MRTFLTILVACCIFCQNSFATISRSERDKQLAQQKMTQLQQLLSQVSQSNGLPASNINSANTNAGPSLLASSPVNLPNSLAPVQSGINSSSNAQSTSAAGVVSAPFAVAQNDTSAPSNASATQNSVSLQPNVYDQAFSGVVNQLLPMKPEQVAKLRQVFMESQFAASVPSEAPPKPTSSSLLINLSPQAVPPVIRLGAGYITSLVFIDVTGQPWPIAAYSIGDPSAFNIQWDHKGNTLLIQSATFYKRSNLAVMLRDFNTPIMLTLISGQEVVDYRVDARVPGIGPNAIAMQNGIPDAVNPILFDVLNGIPPKGSKEIKVRGGDCQAWFLDKKLYLRTSLNVTSPGWQAIMSSADGTHAYQLQPAPVILALRNGKDRIITLTLEGLE